MPSGAVLTTGVPAGKCFQDRNGHVVQARRVDEDVSLIVILPDPVPRYGSREFNISQLQLTHQFHYRVLLRSLTHQRQTSFRKLLLDPRESADNEINTVIRSEAARTHQQRPQWAPGSKGELARIDEVGHNFNTEAELPENVRQIFRRDNKPVSPAQNGQRGAPIAQVIAGFAAVVMNQGPLARNLATNQAGAGASKKDQ